MISLLALGISLAVLGGTGARIFKPFPRYPVDCQVQYSSWTECDASCGQGQQSRWGFVTTPAQNGGRPCPELEQTRPCDSGIPCTPPPLDCQVRYSDWTECDAPCGQGRQQRWGTILVAPANGGTPCPELEQERVCDSGVSCTPNPVDCEVRFGEWSECSKLCGSGQQWRQGVVIREPQFGGQPCPSLEQERFCNQNECTETNMDCEVWYGEWSSCSVSCGGGFQWRKAVIEVPQKGFGKPCPELVQERPCNQFQCSARDQDCQVWFAEWSDCNKPCGGGFQTRRGVIEQDRVGNGLACPPLEQRRPCNELIQCTDNVVDCQVTYSEWTACSRPCGGGERRRWGTVVVPPTNGGRPCGTLEQSETCNEDLCDVAVVDCLMRFSEWSYCSAPCGGGVQQRWGEIVVVASNGGKPCPPEEQQRECNQQPCFEKVDCQVRFADWSQCTASCGGGLQWRRGVVVEEPKNGGLPCPALEEERACNQVECDEANVDCQMWYGEWSTCDQPCGGGQQFRRGVVEVPQQGSGIPCPPAMQYRSCNQFECSEPQPTDCQVSFSRWTECSRPCGGGTRNRWGTIVQEPRMGGAPCPALEQEETCNEQLCGQNIQDCQVDFTEWTQCSSPCAGGKQQRWGTVRVQPTPGGQPCPSLEQERDCNTDINCIPGVQDCLVQYSPWSVCSKPCNGGKRRRWGVITQEASPGGKPCPELEQEEDCNTQSCQPSKPFRPIEPFRPNFIPQIRYQCNGFGRSCRTCDLSSGRCPTDSPLYTSLAECESACAKPSSVIVSKFYCAGADVCEQCRGKLRAGQFEPITCPVDTPLYDSERQCGRSCSNFLPVDIRYFCGSLDGPCQECDLNQGLCPQDIGLYRSAGECNYKCKPGISVKSRPKRNVATLYYCAADVEGNDDGVVGCQYCTKTSGGEDYSKVAQDDCPNLEEGKTLYESQNECAKECSGPRSKRSVQRFPSRQYFPTSPQQKYFPRFPQRPINNKKPKVPFDCTRKEDGTYSNTLAKCSNIFYMCSNGGAEEMKCAKNLYYNDETQECDIHAYVPSCSGGRRPATTTPEPRVPAPVTPDPEFDCTKRPNDVFEDPRQKCSPKFYSCSNGQTTREECQENLFYDSKTKSCLAWANIYKCSGKVPKKPVVKPVKNFDAPKPVPVDCRKLGNGAFPDPRKECSQTWYSCANGNGYEMTCPALTFFNPALKDCDAFNNIYACSRRKPVPQIPTPPPPQPEKFPFDCSNREDGYFQAGNCFKFYWACSGGVTSKMPCGDDMVYDTELKICDFKFNIPQCGGVRPTLPPVIPTQPRPRVDFDCLKRKDGNFPAGKCQPIYFSCSGGEPNKMRCPNNLFYDSETDECGIKKYVPECGGKRPPKEPLPYVPQPYPQPLPLPTPYQKPFPVRNTAGRNLDVTNSNRVPFQGKQGFNSRNVGQVRRNLDQFQSQSRRVGQGRNLDQIQRNLGGSSASGVIGGRERATG